MKREGHCRSGTTSPVEAVVMASLRQVPDVRLSALKPGRLSEFGKKRAKRGAGPATLMRIEDEPDLVRSARGIDRNGNRFRGWPAANGKT